MANPYWNRRRGSSSGGKEWSGAVDYMAGKGRAPSFDAAGNVRGFRSRLGARSSPRNAGTIGIDGDFGGGLTPDSEWEGFFGRRGSTPKGGAWAQTQKLLESQPQKASQPIIPSPDMSQTDTSWASPNAWTPPDLTADVPQDAQAMAADLGDFQYQGDVPPTGEMSADDYLNSVIGDNEVWFNQTGNINPGGPTKSGTTFMSPKYGSGTVRFSKEPVSNSYSERLKRLGEADINDL